MKRSLFFVALICLSFTEFIISIFLLLIYLVLLTIYGASKFIIIILVRPLSFAYRKIHSFRKRYDNFSNNFSNNFMIWLFLWTIDKLLIIVEYGIIFLIGLLSETNRNTLLCLNTHCTYC